MEWTKTNNGQWKPDQTGNPNGCRDSTNRVQTRAIASLPRSVSRSAKQNPDLEASALDDFARILPGSASDRDEILSDRAFGQPIQLLTDGKEIAVIEPHATAPVLK